MKLKEKDKMQKVKVEIKKSEGCDDLPLPKYMSEHASGMDLLAAVEGSLFLEVNEIKLVSSGISIAVPPGFEAQVRPRSGLALKNGITVVNSPGTVDADYRGEVGVILRNSGSSRFEITRGMRIAQMVIQPVVQADLIEVKELSATDRGEGGFGHTGH